VKAEHLTTTVHCTVVSSQWCRSFRVISHYSISKMSLLYANWL